MDEAGRNGLEVEVEATPASQDVDVVDKFSLMSGSVHGATISRWVVPSRGDNVVAEGVSCSPAVTAPGGHGDALLKIWARMIWVCKWWGRGKAGFRRVRL
jgi:hypothetical protein